MFKKIFGFIVAIALVAVLAGCKKQELDLKLGRARYAAHGEKAFADVVVVLDGDKIIAVSLDEYQIGSAEDFNGVPNSEKAFGKDIAEGKVLYSKLENDDKYSTNMTKSGSTQNLSKSYEAIVNFAIGKTVKELETEIAKDGFGKDSVSGSTLVDTKGYVESIIAAAKKAVAIDKIEVKKVDIKLGRVRYAAHGDKAFADVVAVLNGDKIIAVSLDEYQIGSANDFIGVPNSDKSFGNDIAEGKVLYSKLENDDKYSSNMTKSGSTQNLSKSYEAIVKFTLNKTVKQLNEEVAKDGFGKDSVSGSTLVDTKGYVESIIKAAEAAK